MTNEVFCEKYKLDKKVLKGMDVIQFYPGAKLSLVTKEEKEKAGFTNLSWDRLM